MANTTNLNMVKPAGTDHALISVINSNMDIIDGAVGALPSGSTLQGEIDSANTHIGTLQGQASRTIQWINSGSLDDCTDPTKVYSWGNVSVGNIPAIYAKMYYIPGDVPMQYCVTNDGTSSMIRVNTGSWSSWTYIASKSDISTGVTVRRSIVTTSSSVAAGGDYAITTQAITNGVVGGVPTGYTQLAIIPEGVRPNTSWNADPRLFYNDVSTMQKFQIHNHGSSGDTMTATFIIFYVKNA